MDRDLRRTLSVAERYRRVCIFRWRTDVA